MVLPELFGGRYFPQAPADAAFFAWAEPVPGPTTAALAAVARRLGIIVVGSVYERALPGLHFNTAVVLGPDLDRFAPGAVDRLLAGPFAVDARSDRIGTRLVGPALERLDADDGLSAPMVRGAIQVPASGQPIVLGPDHPTTGGYPVIATVVRGSIGALGARPVGAPVRFVTASFRRA